MSPARIDCRKWTLLLALPFAFLGVAAAQAPPARKATGVTLKEQQRKDELQVRLCRTKDLGCKYVTSILADPRLVIYQPPPPAPQQPPPGPRERQRNPYLTDRFGLLTPQSLERCRAFIGSHEATFEAAREKYGVPAEVICGHLRIETDFGIPTKLSPTPFGTRPALNQLVSMYVRNPSVKDDERFTKRQEFAFTEIRNLIVAAKKLDWDLYKIPGSPTGAIGLTQFEPSSFSVAVDGNGDGRIDLFDPDDAIMSVAHYLVTRGWDRNPEHQKRAIYAYYGGHYDQDPRKYYMNAVLKYSGEVRAYLAAHPLEQARL